MFSSIGKPGGGGGFLKVGAGGLGFANVFEKPIRHIKVMKNMLVINLIFNKNKLFYKISTVLQVV